MLKYCVLRETLFMVVSLIAICVRMMSKNKLQMQNIFRKNIARIKNIHMYNINFYFVLFLNCVE
jgi:hypothetical protein